jgi:hypothetical protein
VVTRGGTLGRLTCLYGRVTDTWHGSHEGTLAALRRVVEVYYCTLYLLLAAEAGPCMNG